MFTKKILIDNKYSPKRVKIIIIIIIIIINIQL